ncbi:MAG TPA: serine/threonine-protein kinase [Ktedonobacteraceae bacterium]
MQEHIQTTHTIGTLLQKRYVVEDLLGKGGFGAVYLVRDQQDNGELAALKELRDQDNNEKKRLLFECEILKRLDHPALPQFKGLFEENNRLYMLMEYIQGQNLEILRKKRDEGIFTFAEVVALLQPIITAVDYLHQQQPPLLHRDIKPANIVVSKDEKRTVLVDFGIAKEYHADATTTAIRHCSPGYSAPEQYSSMGTDSRVDVYELGATCYTLLTGAPPVDALHRLTKVASRGIDPLVRVDELVADVPLPAVEAIQIALNLNYERRFTTAEAFWQAFTATKVSNKVHGVAQPPGSGDQPASSTQPARGSKRSRRTRLALLTVCALLISGLVLGLAFYALHSPISSASGPLHQPTSVQLTGGPYPTLTASYVGTLDNVLAHTTVAISLVNISQTNQSLRGFFSEGHVAGTRPFMGVVDGAKHILLTMAGQKGRPPLFFEGVVRSDGSLAGNYCSVDAAGQCSGGEYGLWSLISSAAS